MSQDDSKFELTSRSWQELSVAERRNKLLELECVCKSMEQVVIEPREYFCNGVYAREIFIPAGTTLVGEIHNYPHINVVSKGKIRVATDEGVKVIEAPCTFISPAGVKRAGFVLEDTVWTTIHATDKTNSNDIRQEVIAESYESLRLNEVKT